MEKALTFVGRAMVQTVLVTAGVLFVSPLFTPHLSYTDALVAAAGIKLIVTFSHHRSGV